MLDACLIIALLTNACHIRFIFSVAILHEVASEFKSRGIRAEVCDC